MSVARAKSATDERPCRATRSLVCSALSRATKSVGSDLVARQSTHEHHSRMAKSYRI